MEIDLQTLLAFAGGVFTVYIHNWQKGRAAKEDESKIYGTIHAENEKQNKESEKNNDQQHKRVNQIQEDAKEVQYKLGYEDGDRKGYHRGLAEARAQFDVFQKMIQGIK